MCYLSALLSGTAFGAAMTSLAYSFILRRCRREMDSVHREIDRLRSRLALKCTDPS